jgi:hypothetical protein
MCEPNCTKPVLPFRPSAPLFTVAPPISDPCAEPVPSDASVSKA